MGGTDGLREQRRDGALEDEADGAGAQGAVDVLVLSAVALASMDDVASTAEAAGDRTLRSLDAIHLATAQELRAELTAFVCYDKRLRESARALGLPVEAPG